MYICVYQGFALIRTSFNEKYDLIQKFRGLENESIRYNKPIDFMESGLMQKDKWDCWHIDIPFALNTDEAVPACVNGCYIGANHGHNGATQVYAPDHGKTYADVGSIWVDEKGVKFTLMRVDNEDYLLFLSQNIGSVTRYKFIQKIEGKLSFVSDGVHTQSIVPQEQSPVDLRRVTRHTLKQAYAFTNGKWRRVKGGLDCDYVELREEYDIINPATVASALTAGRPNDGYAYQPDLADYGQAMLSCKITYRILPDGTVLTLFDYKKKMPVPFERWIGVMFQEKLDVYGGGIYRYLPKTLPFTTKEGTFDFSKGVAIVGEPFPERGKITKEYWSNPDSPCERVVDYFRDKEKNDKLAFTAGFLPVYDGEPSIRKNNLTDVVTLKYTRKHYPTFMNGDIDSVRGVGYKKYFLPTKNGASYYKVVLDGKTYIYADFFKANTLKISLKNEPKLLEKSDGITVEYNNGELVLTAEKGYASFVVEE